MQCSSFLIFPLYGFLFQFFDIIVNAMQFFRNINTLRTMRAALVASRAMVGLAELGYASVIADQIDAPCLFVIVIFSARNDIPFVQAFVVMQQDSRNIYAIRARHTILAIVTWDCFVLHHHGSGFLQEFQFLFRQRL